MDSAEFQYRPVSVTAILALVIGVCSLSSFLFPTMLVLALCGSVLGVVSWAILRASNDVAGRPPAVVGTIFSLASLLMGTSLHAYWYSIEAPSGYARIDFDSGIARKYGDIANGRFAPHPDVAALAGRKICVEGYAWWDSKHFGTNQEAAAFLLTSDGGPEGFGAQPAEDATILIMLRSGERWSYDHRFVAVSGEFDVNEDPESDDVPRYVLTNATVRPATSAFGYRAPGERRC